MNGDYEKGPYGQLQAQLCEHMLNEFYEENVCLIFKWYNEKTKLLGARRKRLWEDHDEEMRQIN